MTSGSPTAKADRAQLSQKHPRNRPDSRPGSNSSSVLYSSRHRRLRRNVCRRQAFSRRRASTQLTRCLVQFACESCNSLLEDGVQSALYEPSPIRAPPLQHSQISLRSNQTNSGKAADTFDLPGPERNSDSDYRNRDYQQSRWTRSVEMTKIGNSNTCCRCPGWSPRTTAPVRKMVPVHKIERIQAVMSFRATR
jgi:hypothetical protein